MASELLLNILGPILLMVGLGALLRWRFKVDLATLSKLNIYIFTPAFIFERVATSKLPLADLGGAVVVTVMNILLLAGICFGFGLALRVNRKTIAAVAMAVMFYNSGNYGLPLAELAYPSRGGSGQLVVASDQKEASDVARAAGHWPLSTNHSRPQKDGAAVQTFVVMVQNVLTFTLGTAIAAGATGGSFRVIATKVLTLPVLYVLAAGLIGRYLFGPGTGREMPVILSATVGYLSKGLVPVALLTLGAQLASNPRWPRWKPVSLVLFARLIAGPVSMTGLLYGLHTLLPGTFLDLWPWPAESLILTAGVPSAINTLLLTMELEGDTELTADCVFWTTIFSSATILGWLAILRVAFAA
jgi:predicted permease